MTIVVTSLAPDGIVLASDSRTTQERGHHHRVASDAAQKIYSAWNRIGLGAYGMATIGDETIRGVIHSWLARADGGEGPEAVAHELAEFLHARLDAATPARRSPEPYEPAWPLGVLVAGYDSGGVGRVFEARVWPRHQSVEDLGLTTTKPSSTWRGQTTAIRRLINGADANELKGVGVTVTDDMRKRIETMAYDLIQPTTVQDAIDLAHFVVETTVQMQRFSDGTYASPKQIPGCGGPTQCLAVTSSGTVWISDLALAAPDRRRRDDRD